jgi:hypothetical protein
MMGISSQPRVRCLGNGTLTLSSVLSKYGLQLTQPCSVVAVDIMLNFRVGGGVLIPLPPPPSKQVYVDGNVTFIPVQINSALVLC